MANDFQGIEILEEGIDVLCRNDPDARALAAPRHAEIISLLRKYIIEIEAHNPAYGLVASDERQELIQRHILDSLAPLGLFCRLLKDHAGEQIPRIADLGSGAGLPGIPLAIAMPQANFTLIERMSRRAGFLRSTRQALGLTNVTVIEDELEKFAHNAAVKNSSGVARFDLVTFRAFRPLEPKILKGLFRICAADGVIAAYKGRREKIDAEISELEKYFAASANRLKMPMPEIQVIPCPTPLLAEERHILLIRRTAADRVTSP